MEESGFRWTRTRREAIGRERRPMIAPWRRRLQKRVRACGDAQVRMTGAIQSATECNDER